MYIYRKSTYSYKANVYCKKTNGLYKQYCRFPKILTEVGFCLAKKLEQISTDNSLVESYRFVQLLYLAYIQSL